MIVVSDAISRISCGQYSEWQFAGRDTSNEKPPQSGGFQVVRGRNAKRFASEDSPLAITPAARKPQADQSQAKEAQRRRFRYGCDDIEAGVSTTAVSDSGHLRQ